MLEEVALGEAVVWLGPKTMVIFTFPLLEVQLKPPAWSSYCQP